MVWQKTGGVGFFILFCSERPLISCQLGNCKKGELPSISHTRKTMMLLWTLPINSSLLGDTRCGCYEPERSRRQNSQPHPAAPGTMPTLYSVHSEGSFLQGKIRPQQGECLLPNQEATTKTQPWETNLPFPHSAGTLQFAQLNWILSTRSHPQFLCLQAGMGNNFL